MSPHRPPPRPLYALSLALSLAACDPGGSAPPPVDNTPPPAEKKQGMTWYRDVEPLVQAHCQGCHSPGGIAPFTLQTYEEAKAMHAPISAAVQARRMPPWMPAGDCGSFAHDRSLTQDQINTLYSWSADGAPAGDPKDAPPPQPIPSQSLPWIDATVDPGATYTPPAQALTDYRCFILDPKLAKDVDLIGYEVLPGVRQMVHHVLLYPADAAEAKALDDKSAGTGWTCFGGPGTQRTSTLGGWVPGSPPTLMPQGTGLLIKAGQVLIMQIHYDNHGGGVWGADRTTLKLQYAKEAVRRAQILPMANVTFNVPPGSTNYTVTAEAKVPANLTLYGVLPHAHQLGRRMRVETASTCLVDIPRWDFSWQQMYFYKAGLPLRQGAPLKLTCVFDNPGPKPLRWGEETTDEMCLNYFYFTVP